MERLAEAAARKWCEFTDVPFDELPPVGQAKLLVHMREVLIAAGAVKGFVVIESCENYEQILVLKQEKELPPGGILDWADRRDRDARAVFGTKSDARAAIERTEHYRLAYGRPDLPERKFCSVVPVRLVAT